MSLTITISGTAFEGKSTLAATIVTSLTALGIMDRFHLEDGADGEFDACGLIANPTELKRRWAAVIERLHEKGEVITIKTTQFNRPPTAKDPSIN